MLRKFFHMPSWYKIWTLTVSFSLLYSVFEYFSNGRTLLGYIAMIYALGSILLDNYLFPLRKTTDSSTVKNKANSSRS